MTEMVPPVAAALAAADVPHRVFVHPGPVHSSEQAAQERGQLPDQVVRSILFRVGEGEYVMGLVAGPAQISWKALRRYLGQSRLTTADRDEVKRVTGYEIGAVSPFGMPTPVRVLIDTGVSRQQEVSIGSGVRGTTVILQVADLMRALGDVEIVDLTDETAA